MKIYKYKVSKIDGNMDNHASLEELAKHLNKLGRKGYKLNNAIPQVHEGTTESTILIFETEDYTEDCTIG